MTITSNLNDFKDIYEKGLSQKFLLLVEEWPINISLNENAVIQPAIEEDLHEETQ